MALPTLQQTACYEQGVSLSGPACHDLLQVSEKRSEAERETRKRERLEKESRDLRVQVDAKNDEVSRKCACAGSATAVVILVS